MDHSSKEEGEAKREGGPQNELKIKIAEERGLNRERLR